MTSEGYTATYTPASNHNYTGLHRNSYSDLQLTTQDLSDDNITTDIHYIEIKEADNDNKTADDLYMEIKETDNDNITPDDLYMEIMETDNDNITPDDFYMKINDLDDGSPNSYIRSSRAQRDTSEQSPREEPASNIETDNENTAETTTEVTSRIQTTARNEEHSCHQSRRLIIAIVAVVVLSVIGLATTLTLMVGSGTPCTSLPCLHGGQCSIKDHTFNCTCLEGFGGSRCQGRPLGEHAPNTLPRGLTKGKEALGLERTIDVLAEKYCKEMKNGILAEPNTRRKIDFLKTKARDKYPFDSVWIGGSDLQTESKWRWESTNSLISTADWHNGADSIEPNDQNGNEDCVFLSNGFDFEWNDVNCLGEDQFICEKKVGS